MSPGMPAPTAEPPIRKPAWLKVRFPAGERYQRGVELADALIRVLDVASLDTPSVRAARLARLTPVMAH